MNQKINMQIICKDFKQKRRIQGKLIVDEASSEYYIIPLTKSFEMDYDESYQRLYFQNQLLWLKYSNRNKEILVKDEKYDEYIIIKAQDIFDVELDIITDNYFRKNVWSSKTTVNVGSAYDGKYLLSIPIIEDMFSVETLEEGFSSKRISMVTNEVLLRKVKHRGGRNYSVYVTNNFLLNKEALFIQLDSYLVDDF